MSSAAGIDAMERDALTSDGLAIHLRCARLDDAQGIAEFHEQDLSDAAAYFRFFGSRPHLTSEVIASWSGADGVNNATMLAFHEDRIVAVAMYRRVDETTADAAFAVADELQHRGIGTLLIEDLAVLARRAGYQRLIAETLPSNSAMKAVFHDAGLEVRSRFNGGVTDVDMPLGDGARMAANADLRDRAATVASLQPLLCPTHVVVFGASATSDKPGNAVVRNLRTSFTGQVSVVHPSAREVNGEIAHRSATVVVGDPDLAIIAVPADAVPAVIDDCGAAGIRAAVILSAGFTEMGPRGAELEAEVLRRARRHGMRLVGPNCFGVVNTAIGLDATFGVVPVVPGRVAFASQSGGLGIALLAEAAQRGLGISSFVSLGNKIDVSSNDLLCAWADDLATSVIALYLESFGNARKFARLARSISVHRPIVALKGGRSGSGQRGAKSHTAALATNDVVVDALFAHGGVIRAHTLEELLDIVSVLDTQPLPTGSRVAIIGNAGGPLILAADAAEASALVVPELSGDLQARIRKLVPAAAATANPVDLLATVSAEQIHGVIDAIAESGECDSLVVVTVPVAGPAIDQSRVGRAEMPVLRVRMGTQAHDRAVGGFAAPERALHALARVAAYAAWRRQRGAEVAEEASPDTLDEVEAAASEISGCTADADGWVQPDDAFHLLSTLGFHTPRSSTIRTDEQLATALEQVGLPVVMKAAVAGVVHKTEAGAIALDLKSADDASAALRRFHAVFVEKLDHVLVQQQCPPGIELILGVSRSERYGPLLVIGAGGIAAEVLGDSVVLLAPATETEVREALDGLRIAPLLRGYRGAEAADLEHVVRCAVRLGQLADLAPQIAEMDINPLIVSGSGSTAVDVRLRVSDVDGGARPLRGLRPAAVR